MEQNQFNSLIRLETQPYFSKESLERIEEHNKVAGKIQATYQKGRELREQSIAATTPGKASELKRKAVQAIYSAVLLKRAALVGVVEIIESLQKERSAHYDKLLQKQATAKAETEKALSAAGFKVEYKTTSAGRKIPVNPIPKSQPEQLLASKIFNVKNDKYVLGQKSQDASYLLNNEIEAEILEVWEEL